MNYLLVKNDVAINVVVWDGVSPYDSPPDCTLVEQPAGVAIGWRLVDGTWQRPAPPPPKPVTVVTMRQARLALLQAGLLASVDQAIADIADLAKKAAAQIEWEYAQEVKRNSPLVVQISAGLGLDDAAIDGLFQQAASL